MVGRQQDAELCAASNRVPSLIARFGAFEHLLVDQEPQLSRKHCKERRGISLARVAMIKSF